MLIADAAKVKGTGFGPKRLGRIGRMQRVLAAGRGESWARRPPPGSAFEG